MNIDFSTATEPRGYACLAKNGEDLMIYLNNILELLPHLNTRFVPFRNIEDLIEEWVIHELIHKITRIKEDSIVDKWHVILCRLLSNRNVCNCPIDCFWRNQTK